MGLTTAFASPATAPAGRCWSPAPRCRRRGTRPQM